MELTPRTITEEFSKRIHHEQRYHSKQYRKSFEPFFTQPLSSMVDMSFPAVDLWHGLWYQGEMACLFGEPNVGKTTLAMQIADEVSRRGLKTIFFDLENARHQFKQRYQTGNSLCNIDNDRLVVKYLNPNCSLCPYDSRSILDYIKKEIIQEKAPVIVIDDITHIIGSGDQADVRLVFNRLRDWAQRWLVSILVLAHSGRRRHNAITTIESLAGSFEYSYAFDSIFSLNRANRYNAQEKHTSHYIKHHKNRMGPVLYDEFNVITAWLSRDEESGVLQFNELYTGGNERQLLRDNGYQSSEQVKEAILKYHRLFFTTREIAEIVGCSQSHVSKTISKHEAKQECDNSSSTTTDPTQQQANIQEQDALLLSINVKPMPRIKLEPNREQIYDESLYVIDQHGFLMTKKDYILLYGTTLGAIPLIPPIPPPQPTIDN